MHAAYDMTVHLQVANKTQHNTSVPCYLKDTEFTSGGTARGSLSLNAESSRSRVRFGFCTRNIFIRDLTK